jgi:hypothetical protein
MPHQPIPREPSPDELLAMVTHELRRPLTAMLGALATLQHHHKALPVLQQQELLGMAHRQGEQLTGCANSHVERAAQNQPATSAPGRIYATSGTRPSSWPIRCGRRPGSRQARRSRATGAAVRSRQER